jgi:hypothetical protein
MKKIHILKGTIKIIKIKKLNKNLLLLFKQKEEEYKKKYPFLL